jgi:hypothetical protein
MNRIFLTLALGLLLVGLAPAVNAASCDTQGTWIGELEGGGKFLETIHGQSKSKGTLDLEWFEYPPDFFGTFPTAVEFSQAKGVWKKVSARTYKYTMVTYALDASGNVVYSVVNSGTKKLAKDCKTASILGCFEFFLADGTPVGCGGCGNAFVTRLEVQNACEP